MKKYDAIVIGFGKAGKTLAGDMATRGHKVALIEKSNKMYGGTCINIGCIPTKYLILQGEKQKKQVELVKEEAGKRYQETVHEKNKIISVLRQKNFDMLAGKENIDIFDGIASFVSNKEVEVKVGEERIQLTADKIFINTGAETVFLPIPGLKKNSYVYDSESIMELETLPKKLLIIGGGYIGLEFAGMFSNFGSEVIVLEGSPRFIPREDLDVAEEIKKGMEAQGVEILLGAKVTEISENTVKFEMDGEAKSREADAILVAVGRKPNIKDLKLENTDIKLSERGAIQVDDQLHSSVEGIWAMGDVHGGLQFTYTSLDDYRIVRSELFGDESYTLKKRTVVPYTVFLHPNFSRVGLTEEEALKQGYEIKVAKMPPATPRMKIGNETEGYLKAVVDAKTGKILGVSLYCAYSGELINQVALAMVAEKEYTFLRDFIFTHPTASEMLNDLFAQIK